MDTLKNAQDIFNENFLESDSQNSNETLDLLNFMRSESTALNESQLKGIMLLNEMDMPDIANAVFNLRQFSTHKDTYYKLIDKLTLADRIKGNAKLSHLMKSEGVSNPAQSLKPSDVQAQGMKRSEIDRY